jgi:hypothetical protein
MTASRESIVHLKHSVRGATFGVFVALACMVSGACRQASAQEDWPAREERRKQGFESFRIISERNVFSPSRRRPRTRDRAPEPPPPPSADHLDLIGAMVDGGWAVAFFSGSEADYERAAQQGDLVAGHSIAEIRPIGVVLAKGQERIDLPVGARLEQRPDDKTWRLISREEAKELRGERRQSDNRSRSDEVSEDSSPDDSGDDKMQSDEGNAVLRKLIERRRKELGE